MASNWSFAPTGPTLERAITPDAVYKLVRQYSTALGFAIGAHALRAITARPGRRTVRPSKSPIRECWRPLSVTNGPSVFTLDFRRGLLPTRLIASASCKVSGSRRRRDPPWLERRDGAHNIRSASKLPCVIDAVSPDVVWFGTAPEWKCRLKFADDPLRTHRPTRCPFPAVHPQRY
jgi:hypothetical protein